MAEYIMKALVAERGLADEYVIESAATSTEEIGNSIYPPARRMLAEHGITACGKHRARQLCRSDYSHFDLLVGMDEYNIRNMLRICGGDPDGKIKLLLDFTEESQGRSVADPWYTGNFQATWDDCLQGCQAILELDASSFRDLIS